MPLNSQLKNHHLLWRAGFGVDVNLIEKINSSTYKELFSSLQKANNTEPEYFDVADNSIKGILMGVNDAVKMQELIKNGLDNETKKKIRQQSREDIKNLNLKWVEEMVNGANPLREKLALFWHGHFACRDVNIFFQQKLLQEIRTNALSSFKDLLFAVSKSASMLSFLNNQQNKKQHPNENFAREVMELFTLGRGNYTEQDVKEAARAFTGWGFNIAGEFQFRSFQHDNGSKTFLGKTGNFDGDDILNILLEQKQTATYITQKIYKYFVNEKINDEIVKNLSKKFYQSNYNISSLLENIFTSNWFYDEKNIGTKIKSPIELLVGIRKTLPMELENPEIQLLLQKALGQVLFYPPNVAGWPGGKNWIDSSSLMIRLQIPRLFKEDETFSISTKTDDDQQMGMREMYKSQMQNAMGNKFKIKAKINWQEYIDQYKDVKRENLFSQIKQSVLQTNVQEINENNIGNNIDKSSRESFIKTATISLMSTPEYQMC
jgi:uncharacterized protein (DUF1800 family)